MGQAHRAETLPTDFQSSDRRHALSPASFGLSLPLQTLYRDAEKLLLTAVSLVT
jgi:hypothetical protein